MNQTSGDIAFKLGRNLSSNPSVSQKRIYKYIKVLVKVFRSFLPGLLL